MNLRYFFPVVNKRNVDIGIMFSTYHFDLIVFAVDCCVHNCKPAFYLWFDALCPSTIFFWMDNKGSLSVRPAMERFQEQRSGNFWETAWERLWVFPSALFPSWVEPNHFLSKCDFACPLCSRVLLFGCLTVVMAVLVSIAVAQPPELPDLFLLSSL